VYGSESTGSVVGAAVGGGVVGSVVVVVVGVLVDGPTTVDGGTPLAAGASLHATIRQFTAMASHRIPRERRAGSAGHDRSSRRNRR
jgi:hypothetical protein